MGQDRVGRIPAPPHFPVGHELNIASPALWCEAPPVLVVSGCTWACTGGAQRPVALARSIASMGYPTVYHHGGQYDNENWYVGGPIVLNRLMYERALPHLMQRPGTAIVCLPIWMELVEPLKQAGWTIVYDCIDDWKAMADSGYSTWYTEETEVQAMQEADLITVSAPVLADVVMERSRKQAVLIRNAGPTKPFEDYERPDDCQQGRNGTVVYCGDTTGTWFDWELMARTIRDLPRVQFNIIGPYRAKDVPRADNVTMFGPRPYPEAMHYVANANVGIIPFKDEAICASVDPVKWYDYVAARIWTVATHVMSDLRDRPWTIVSSERARTLTDEIKEALKHERPSLEEAEDYMVRNCWKSRAIDLLDEVGHDER